MNASKTPNTTANFARLTLLTLLLLLPACSGPNIQAGPSKAPASIQIQQGQAEVTRANVDLVGTDGKGGALATVAAMTPENLPEKRPQAMGEIGSASRHLGVATTQMVSAGAAATATEKREAAQGEEIKRLKAADPARTVLNWTGIGSFVLGIGILIASIFVAFLHGLPWLRAAAVGMIAFGVCLITIAHFLTQIYWIAGLSLLACAIGGGVYLVTHRNIVKAVAKDAIGWVPVDHGTVTP